MRNHPLPRLLLAAALVTAGMAPFGSAQAQGTPAQDPTFADVLIPEMEQVFAESQGMITHTQTVLGHALDIQGHEGGNLTVVKAAAILHDIGRPKAMEIHGSSSGQYQEIEGPPIAREILTRLDFPAAQIDHVCGIIANHHSDADPEIVTTLEFKVLWDSDWLVNFPGRYRQATEEEKAEAVETIFKTARGKELAREMFLG